MKSDKADTDMSAAAQSDTRWNMVADSPDGDEQVWGHILLQRILLSRNPCYILLKLIP